MTEPEQGDAGEHFAQLVAGDPLPDETPAEALVREWYRLWATQDYMPGKLPDGLHLRTMVYLMSRRHTGAPPADLDVIIRP